MAQLGKWSHSRVGGLHEPDMTHTAKLMPCIPDKHRLGEDNLGLCTPLVLRLAIPRYIYD